jgi:hypothetical protein
LKWPESEGSTSLTYGAGNEAACVQLRSLSQSCAGIFVSAPCTKVSALIRIIQQAGDFIGIAFV